jgi:hypothetical protein
MTHLLNTLLEQGVENVSEATPEAYRRRKVRREENQ